jgi:hypothetical protein
MSLMALMTIPANLKVLLKDPLPFKDKGGTVGSISHNQVLREKAICDNLITELIESGETIASTFRSSFKRAPAMHLAYARKKAAPKHNRYWLSWRKRGQAGRGSSFVKLTPELLSSELPDMQTLLIEFEYIRGHWQTQYNLLLGYRMSLDSLDNYYNLLQSPIYHIKETT